MSDNLLILRALYHSVPSKKRKIRQQLRDIIKEIRHDGVYDSFRGGIPSRRSIMERPKRIKAALKRIDKEPI